MRRVGSGDGMAAGAAVQRLCAADACQVGIAPSLSQILLNLLEYSISPETSILLGRLELSSPVGDVQKTYINEPMHSCAQTCQGFGWHLVNGVFLTGRLDYICDRPG